MNPTVPPCELREAALPQWTPGPKRSTQPGRVGGVLVHRKCGKLRVCWLNTKLCVCGGGESQQPKVTDRLPTRPLPCPSPVFVPL